MATSPRDQRDGPPARETGPAANRPRRQLALADLDDADAPAAAKALDDPPFGAVVAFDGSSSGAWMAVARDCCIELPDTR